MNTFRTGAALAAAALLTAGLVNAPAQAAPVKKPKLGDWTCTLPSSVTEATLTLKKGNKYSVDDGSNGKYVYKAGVKKLKFKTGDYTAYYGTYDPSSKAITLFSAADDSAAGGCLHVPELPAP